jgi:hypothetical protein
MAIGNGLWAANWISCKGTFFMNKSVWIGLLVVGVILIVLGVQGMNSLESDVSRFFRGTPTDKSVWMLVGGILCAVGGAVGLMRK